jgi:hypothetical protein
LNVARPIKTEIGAEKRGDCADALKLNRHGGPNEEENAAASRGRPLTGAALVTDDP